MSRSSVSLFLIACMILATPMLAQGPIKIDAPEGSDVTVTVTTNTTFWNWAGSYMWLQNWDPSEVDIISVTGLGVQENVWNSPFGTASNNTSSMKWFTTFFAAPTTVTSNSFIPIFDIRVQPKNTATGTNSDTDFAWRPGFIFQATTSTVRLSSTFYWSNSVVPALPRTAPQHVTATSVPVAVGQYYGWYASGDTRAVGIDHGVIPEPGAMVLLGSGLLCLGIAVRRRRRKA